MRIRVPMRKQRNSPRSITERTALSPHPQCSAKVLGVYGRSSMLCPFRGTTAGRPQFQNADKAGGARRRIYLWPRCRQLDLWLLPCLPFDIGRKVILAITHGPRRRPHVGDHPLASQGSQGARGDAQDIGGLDLGEQLGDGWRRHSRMLPRAAAASKL